MQIQLKTETIYEHLSTENLKAFTILGPLLLLGNVC